MVFLDDMSVSFYCFMVKDFLLMELNLLNDNLSLDDSVSSLVNAGCVSPGRFLDRIISKLHGFGVLECGRIIVFGIRLGRGDGVIFHDCIFHVAE